MLKTIFLKAGINFYLQSELTIYVESVCAHTKAHNVLTYNDVHANDGLPCIQEDFNALRMWRFFARQLRRVAVTLYHYHIWYISKVSSKFKRDKLFKFRCCLRTEGFWDYKFWTRQVLIQECDKYLPVTKPRLIVSLITVVCTSQNKSVVYNLKYAAVIIVSE